MAFAVLLILSSLILY